MLVVGLILFAVAICALIAAAVWLYGRQSPRRIQQQDQQK